MAHISVSVNGRKYDIACDDGQEAHLLRLGNYVDRRVGELVAAVGQVGDSRLLVMVSLLLADELSDAYSELEGLREGDRGAAKRLDSEEAMAEKLESMAERIADIAERLEGS